MAVNSPPTRPRGAAQGRGGLRCHKSLVTIEKRDPVEILAVCLSVTDRHDICFLYS